MDALANLLDGPRARGAFLLRSILTPPWSVRIEDRAPLTLLYMVRADSWVVPDDGPPVRLPAGDIAVIRGPEPDTVADAPDRPPQIVILPGQVSTDLRGGELCDAMDLGVRTWGDDPDGGAVMITGTYQLGGEISRRLLAALPHVLVLPADAWHSPLPGLLCDEIVKDEPGQSSRTNPVRRSSSTGCSTCC
jgi:hypothetical protein